MRFTILILTLMLVSSCEVVLWQEPSPEKADTFWVSEWTLVTTNITYPSGASKVTVSGRGRPSAMSPYAGSSPGTWSTFEKLILTWEDGFRSSTVLTATETALATKPYRDYQLEAEIPLRQGKWVDLVFTDSWGYSSPVIKIYLEVLP